MAQEPGKAFEREAGARLPQILADLLDEPGLRIDRAERAEGDFALTDSAGRNWTIEAKASASPGLVRSAADHMRGASALDGDVRLLVVPFMTRGAAKVAEQEGLNWLDLAGNAQIRAENLYVFVQGRPNPFRSPGRPPSPFAPRSARIARVMLLDPKRWWRQRDLVDATGLDDGSVSRVARRLEELALITRSERTYRPVDPDLLLTAWADEYRADRHDIVSAQMSGTGIEISRDLGELLSTMELRHAFTGLTAAWAIDHFARFRLTSVYVDGDPREAVASLDLRRLDRGANVQLIAPNDSGVLDGAEYRDGLMCVAPVQAYLDLRGLPERAEEAAEHLRAHHLRWDDRAS